MVFGTQAVLAVFKRTGGKNWPIRKVPLAVVDVWTA